MAANDAMVRLGLLSAGSVGLPLARVALPGVVCCVRDALEECRITRELHSAEHILEAAGKETWWLVASSPVHDASGELTHVVCTFFYVDFLKRTEEALRRSEETLRTLIDQVPAAIVVSDRRSVRYANPAAAALLGVALPGDLVGAAPIDLLDPPDRRAVRSALRSAVKGEATRPVEARVVRADGARVTVGFVPTPTLFEGRTCVLVVARDVTGRAPQST